MTRKGLVFVLVLLMTLNILTLPAAQAEDMGTQYNTGGRQQFNKI
jgi:hypothetical protein